MPVDASLEAATITIAASAVEPDEPSTEPFVQEGHWYLGLDIGTTALAATLFHYPTRQLHPVFWSTPVPGAGAVSTPHLRFPAIVQLSPPSDASPTPHLTVGHWEAGLDADASGIYLRELKRFLKAGIPYFSFTTQTWEPQVAWSSQRSLPLHWFRQALGALLAPLQADQPSVTCTAHNLNAADFKAALSQLEAIVISCPLDGSEAYQFNVREAILANGLVTSPEQILFVEEAIAALLGSLPRPQAVEAGQSPVYRTSTPAPWQGGTLVINAGAETTELLLVNLPANHLSLKYEDFALGHIAYGGLAIDQDLLCQQLPTALWQSDELSSQPPELPLPGEPDQRVRYQLQQYLRGCSTGQPLLDLIAHAKQTLDQQEAVGFRWQEQDWTINQHHLQQGVLTSYIQRLNRELNTLLSKTGLVAEAIRQVVCTGGSSYGAIAHWLKQKLPNAVLVQAADVLIGDRVASGLAQLPLYPAVLNATRHQYSDLFLLKEMLSALPEQPVSLGRLLQLLENRGINTRACQRSILSLLEGQLPNGLVPSELAASLLATQPNQQLIYAALTAEPLFYKPESQVYAFNASVRDRLQQYLSALLDGTHQTLEEPLLYTLPLSQ